MPSVLVRWEKRLLGLILNEFGQFWYEMKYIKSSVTHKHWLVSLHHIRRHNILVNVYDEQAEHWWSASDDITPVLNTTASPAHSGGHPYSIMPCDQVIFMLQTLSLQHTKLVVVSWVFSPFFSRLYSWSPRPTYCTHVLEIWHESPLGCHILFFEGWPRKVKVKFTGFKLKNIYFG